MSISHLQTPEEIERLTVDEELSDIERAVYLLRYFLKCCCETLLTIVFTYSFFSVLLFTPLIFCLLVALLASTMLNI